MVLFFKSGIRIISFQEKKWMKTNAKMLENFRVENFREFYVFLIFDISIVQLNRSRKNTLIVIV